MAKDFLKKIKKPIIALAPMDGYTDSAFRRICKTVNPEIIVFTEFTSADGLHHHAKKVQEKFRYHEDEKPIIAQIFGKDVDTFISAAKYCESMGFSGIDLNMGCPARKVVRSEHGIALRRTHDLAFRLIEAVAKNTNLPVSVKTRLGWSDASDLVDFGIGAQNAGANLITIHGRTYVQGYKNPADFMPIYELKRSVKIPIIGNGGISCVEDGYAKLQNLDGFMIGQAAIGNPWVFLEDSQVPFASKIPIIKKHAQYLIDLKGERVGTLEIRKQLLAYVKSIPDAVSYRLKLVQVNSLANIDTVLDEILSDIGAKAKIAV